MVLVPDLVEHLVFSLPSHRDLSLPSNVFSLPSHQDRIFSFPCRHDNFPDLLLSIRRSRHPFPRHVPCPIPRRRQHDHPPSGFSVHVHPCTHTYLDRFSKLLLVCFNRPCTVRTPPSACTDTPSSTKRTPPSISLTLVLWSQIGRAHV